MNESQIHITLKQILDALGNDSETKRVFEILRNHNPQLDEVKGIKQFLEDHDYDAEALRSFLEESSDGFGELQQTPTPEKANFHWLKVAAIIVPLLGIGLYLFNTSQKKQDIIYADFYQKEMGLPVTMGKNENIIFAEAMNAYKDDSFEEALTGFTTLLQSHPQNDTLLFYMAYSYIELENYTEAIDLFQSIAPSSPFAAKKDFALGLQYVKTNQMELAKRCFNLIEKSKEHPYQTEASQILKKLP